MPSANTSAFSAWTELSHKTLEQRQLQQQQQQQQQQDWEEHTLKELMEILQIPLYNLHLIPHFH